VPPGAGITDDALATWTIGPGQAILRNGVHAGGGYGTQVLWHHGAVYVFGDGSWWRWLGSAWANVGSGDPAGSSAASPDGTSVPPAASIIDNTLAAWTIGPGHEILRNGVHLAAGYGSEIRWHLGAVYVFGEGAWWLWTGSAWVFSGSAIPSS
jgi:hypothetical protein